MKSKLFLLLFASTAVYAADNEVEKAYQSTNIKSSLITVCNNATAKNGKLTAAEVSKYCTCQVEGQARVTDGARWEIQSLMNQKKDPTTLPFVQQQQRALQACLGPQLASKLKTMAEEQAKADQAKK